MKKLLVFMLVLGMASLANATVLDLEISPQYYYPCGGIDGEQLYDDDSSHAGTEADPILVGETLHIDIVLKWEPDSFPDPGYPTYDGYVLSSMDLTVTVSGAGSLSVNMNKKNAPIWGEHPAWSVKGYPTITSGTVLDTGYYESTIGICTFGVDTPVLWNMYVTGESVGTITLTWGLNDPPGEYYDYLGDGVVEDPVAKTLTLGDLGGLMTIYVVPEPTTVALLGLGGLFLLRRRK